MTPVPKLPADAAVTPSVTPLQTPVAPPAQEHVRRDPFPMPWWTLFAVALPALFLRILNIGVQSNFVDDAYIHVPSALFYLQSGWLGPDSWWSPPLKHVLMSISIGLFGNDEIGWRLRGVFFGTAIVVVAFLLARRAFRRPGPAIITAVLLTLDPFVISLGHTTHEDLPAVFFLLLGLTFFLRGLDYDREWEWFAAAMCLGAGIALRWYVLVPLAVVGVAAIWIRRRSIARVVSAAVIFSATPLAVYLMSYLPWLARGYSLAEWMALQLDAFRIQGPQFAGIPMRLLSIGGAERWFTSWLVGGTASSSGTSSVEMSLLLNDPVLWVLFVPSAVYLLVIGVRRSRPEWVTLAATFLGLYGFFLISPRPILLYSAMAIVPLGFVMVGFAAVHLLRQRWPVFLLVATAWSLYLIPLVVHVSNPRVAYAWLLARAVQ